MSRRSSKRAEKLDISYDLDRPSEDLIEVYSTMFAPPAAAVVPFPAPPLDPHRDPTSTVDPKPKSTVDFGSASESTAYADAVHDASAAAATSAVDVDSASTVHPDSASMVDPDSASTAGIETPLAIPASTVDPDLPSTVGVAPTPTVASPEPPSVYAPPRLGIDAGMQPRRKSSGGLARAGDVLGKQEIPAAGTESPVHSTPTPTVDDETTSTVRFGVSPPRPLGGFWTTEGKEGIFPASRVRPIVRAQDALTHPEESVYDLLWGPKNQSKEIVRYTTAGYEKIAAGARIAKENAKKIVARLIYKGFIRLETPPDYLHRIPTKYAVYSYRAALDNMLNANRRYVVRTGNGVLFAHPMARISTVHAGLEYTVDTESSSTADVGQQPTVNVASTETVDAGQQFTVHATSTALGSKSLETSLSNVGTPPVIARAVICEMGFVDDDALKLLAKKCRDVVADATDDEIAELAGMTARRVARMRDIDNRVGLLITQTAKCFMGEPFQMYRRENAERERRFAELLGGGAGREP